MIGKKRSHFIARFKIKLIRRKFHSFRIVKLLLHLYTHQYILHLRIFFAEIMNVVRRNEFDAYFICELNQKRQNTPFFFDAMILNFYVKIVFENIFQIERKFFRSFVITSKQTARNSARKTRRKADNPFGVFF